MTTPTIFLQYRSDMMDIDRAFITVTRAEDHQQGYNYQIDARVDDFKEESPVLRPLRESILTYDALKIIQNVVPLYITTGETFYTIARSMNHGLHHQLDFEQVLELSRELGVSLETIRIIECIITPSQQTDLDAPLQPDECRINVQTAASYFAAMV